MTIKRKTDRLSLRLTLVAREALDHMASHDGVSRTAVLERIIRQAYRTTRRGEAIIAAAFDEKRNPGRRGA